MGNKDGKNAANGAPSLESHLGHDTSKKGSRQLSPFHRSRSPEHKYPKSIE